MVLTDREIQVAIDQKQLIIDPVPPPNHYSSTSVDLLLSPVIHVWRTTPTAGVEPQVFNPGDPDYRHSDTAAAHTDRIVLGAEGIVMKPGDFILGWTSEFIHLPPYSRLAARIEGKSSLARCAISIHVTAPTIHAGFEGQIQLEICNIGPLRVRLLPNMKVCQLIFEQTLGTPHKGYQGQFSKQKAP
jgi:dCTP deaminase